MRLHLRPRALRSLGSAAALALACAGCFDEGGIDFYIPYVPTPEPIVERMLELAEVRADDYLIDLGSGDGRIAITAASRYGARAFGVDIEPKLVQLANENAAKAGVSDKVTFRKQDLFVTPIGDATVIALYLPVSVNIKLRPRLLELRPGTRIVSHAFSMGGWLADVRESIQGVDVYLWIVPARVAGQWQVEENGRQFTVSISQLFQELTVTASIDGRELPLQAGRLRGEQIEFRIDFGDGKPVDYRGSVRDERMLADGAATSWRATRIAGPRAP